MIGDTPNPDNDIQNEYTLTLNDRAYLLHLDIKEEETLIFTCTPIEKKPQFYYIYKCTLNSLRKMSKAFHLYQNLTEVLYLFEELDKNKLISLEIGDDDNENDNDNDNEGSFSMSNSKKNEYPYEFINLVIQLFVLVKEETMTFPMEKRLIKENAKVINNLKNEINKISEDFNNIESKYEKKIQSLKKEVKLLRNENATFKNQISELINKIDLLKNLLNKTNDRKNFNSIQELINRVEKLEEWKNDASISNKNMATNTNQNLNDSHSQQIKSENKSNTSRDNMNVSNNNNEKKESDNKSINKNKNKKTSSNREPEIDGGLTEDNEEIIEEEEVEEEDSDEAEEEKGVEKQNNNNNKENEITDKGNDDKKEEKKEKEKEEDKSEIIIVEEEEEEEDEEEEEKEIINNNKKSFTTNIKSKDKLMKSIISKSSIIKNSYELEFLINKLTRLNPSSFTLLYKGTKDKDESKIFHQKCDNEKNILLFILTNKNYIFGGYTSVGFDSSGNAKKDSEAFLFSVDMQKIYEIKQDLYAIFCNKNCGPIFCAKSDGLYNICIPNKYFSAKSYSCKKGIPFNTTEPFELNHGEKEFQVVELEVYRVDKN